MPTDIDCYRCINTPLKAAVFAVLRSSQEAQISEIRDDIDAETFGAVIPKNQSIRDLFNRHLDNYSFVQQIFPTPKLKPVSYKLVEPFIGDLAVQMLWFSYTQKISPGSLLGMHSGRSLQSAYDVPCLIGRVNDFSLSNGNIGKSLEKVDSSFSALVYAKKKGLVQEKKGIHVLSPVGQKLYKAICHPVCEFVSGKRKRIYSVQKVLREHSVGELITNAFELSKNS